LRRMLAFVRPYRRRLAIALVGVLVATAAGLVFPRILGTLVDSALARSAAGDTREVDRWAVILVLVFTVQAGFNFVRLYFLSSMGEGVVADLRKAVYAHLMLLPVRFFDGRKTGEITSRLTSDVGTVQGAVSTALAQALAQVVTFIGAVTLIVIISPPLALSVLLFLPPMIIAGAFFGRRLRRISTEFQDKVAEANAIAEESIAASRVVKWFTSEPEMIGRYGSAVDESYRVALRRARWRAVFTPTITLVAFGTLAFVLWRGGRLIAEGSMTAGDLVTFLVYTLTVAGALGTFTGLYAQLQEALGASRRIFELLDERSEVTEVEHPTVLDEVAGRITFESVSFGYGDRDVRVLDDVTFQVQPGELVALVGPSGAGKSTLVQLIPRFFDPDAGTILLDDVDVRRLRISDLRKHMAAVPQETQLFSGTIEENLLIGKADAVQEELEAAAAAANAHDFIASFPSGYRTVVGERGVKLSGGQRQRVAIARAVLKDPRVLILDEATSSLDSESESQVQEALDRLMGGRTTIVIAHRLSTVRNADRILVIDGGRIIEDGTHDSLIARAGLYADLFELQFRDEPTPASPPD
jgi:subfamily B ATP-binding cassette protein MsbA